MNEVLKNTHVFVDVLRMARSDEVKQWDESAFEKAFKWAGYFEEASLHVLNYCALYEYTHFDQFLLMIYWTTDAQMTAP